MKLKNWLHRKSKTKIETTTPSNPPREKTEEEKEEERRKYEEALKQAGELAETIFNDITKSLERYGYKVRGKPYSAHESASEPGHAWYFRDVFLSSDSESVILFGDGHFKLLSRYLYLQTKISIDPPDYFPKVENTLWTVSIFLYEALEKYLQDDRYHPNGIPTQEWVMDSRVHIPAARYFPSVRIPLDVRWFRRTDPWFIILKISQLLDLQERIPELLKLEE